MYDTDGAPAGRGNLSHQAHSSSPDAFGGSSPSLIDVCETTLQQLCLATGADAAGLHLIVNGSTQPRLCLQAHAGLRPAEEQTAAVVVPAGSILGRCLQAGALQRRQPGDPGPEWECAPASFVAVPLAVQDEPLGCLWCFARTGQLNPDHTSWLELAALQYAELVLQQRALQQLTEEHGEYRSLARNLRDAIWIVQVEPLVSVLVSDGIEGLTGYQAQEFMDDPDLWVNIIYPDDRPIMMRSVERVASGETDELHHRVRIMRKDGELRWSHTRGRAARDGGGVRLYGLSTDVTDHVRLEEKVRRADRLSAVGMLAGGIAHEYNNLHFAILGTLDLLLMREDFDDSTRQHINRVREAAERASEITTKLVAFARGGNGGRETLDVGELVDSALTLVHKEFSTMGIDIEIKHSPLPLRVHGNRAELGQVLINLIINAQQAMQSRPTRRLTVATGLDDYNRVFISVADTGHGIAAENLPRVFDPFFTTKGAAGSWLEGRAAADAYLPGRGLGLSVAQTIVHEHGGDMAVESEVDCGTRFTIHLPAPDLMHEAPAGEEPAVSGHSGRILIADDEEPVREVCRELLERLSYEVAEAEGGHEALALLEREAFDLVLVDLQMPDMEGLDLIRRINDIPAASRPVKVIITGNIDEVSPDTCAELGISGLLQKRSNLSELATKVQLALASRQAH